MKYLDEEKYEEWHAPNPYAMFNRYAYLIALILQVVIAAALLLMNKPELSAGMIVFFAMDAWILEDFSSIKVQLTKYRLFTFKVTLLLICSIICVGSLFFI